MARWTPSSLAPGTSSSRWSREPTASTTASNSGLQLLGGDVDADVDAAAELDALGLEHGHPPVDEPLLQLEVGDAEAQQPAGRLVAFEDDHPMAGQVQLGGGGHAGRARPDHGHRPPGLSDGGRGSTQPSSKARSMMASSICLIITGSSLISSTQAASHGAGQV